jgi:hypothetical protein
MVAVVGDSKCLYSGNMLHRKAVHKDEATSQACCCPGRGVQLRSAHLIGCCMLEYQSELPFLLLDVDTVCRIHYKCTGRHTELSIESSDNAREQKSLAAHLQTYDCLSICWNKQKRLLVSWTLLPFARPLVTRQRVSNRNKRFKSMSVWAGSGSHLALT